MRYAIFGGAIVAAVLIILAVAISLRPDNFTITRTVIVKAAPDRIFKQVNNFHNWQEWSPWAKLDPKAKITYDGPYAGIGAKYSWSGNDKVGTGSTTITDSRQNELILVDLEMVKPFKATNQVHFVFKQVKDKTLVSWVMKGKNNFLSKAIGLFMNCDAMVGKQFEEGLANLKKNAEKK